MGNERLAAHMGAEGKESPESTIKTGGRFHTNSEVRRIVWIRAAGHCELCGTDLTKDFRIGKTMNWGEVAHILPASPKGPRAEAEYSAAEAEALTNDAYNLILACPNCHEKIDRDAEGYPKEDLRGLHSAFLQRIQLAAKAPDSGKALGLIFLSQHFATQCDIRSRDLLVAMSSEGLSAIGDPIREVLPPPGKAGRDAAYWRNATDRIHYLLETELRRARTFHGDIPALAVAGLADIPALIMLGQMIGDRSTRYLFSPSRGNGLRWPDMHAPQPHFFIRWHSEGKGPIALILSLSASVPPHDVEKALPGSQIVEFTVESPNYGMVKNRGVIHAFRDALQTHLSELEARSPDPIHVFPAIPAAIAVEMGALLTTQHRHPYIIYDRNERNSFVPVMTLPNPTSEPLA